MPALPLPGKKPTAASEDQRSTRLAAEIVDRIAVGSGTAVGMIDTIGKILESQLVRELKTTFEWTDRIIDLEQPCLDGDQGVVRLMISNLKDWFAALKSEGGGGSENHQATCAALCALVGDATTMKGKHAALRRVLGCTYDAQVLAIKQRKRTLDGDNQYVRCSTDLRKDR